MILIPYIHDFSKSKVIEQDEVDAWVRETVRFLIENPGINDYGVATGNARVIAHRGENNEIIVYEFRNYKEYTFDVVNG
jgi:hypothetical protein